jgi:tRNA G18 (ribose-2'-O)-methylase SpoU
MTFLVDRDVTLWGADTQGEPLDSALRPPDGVPRRLALAVGNEGSGLSPQTRDRAERLIALPIGAAVESLNVAVATGIILYELRS